jgi:hypothetical protein
VTPPVAPSRSPPGGRRRRAGGAVPFHAGVRLRFAGRAWRGAAGVCAAVLGRWGPSCCERMQQRAAGRRCSRRAAGGEAVAPCRGRRCQRGDLPGRPVPAAVRGPPRPPAWATR